MTSVRFRFTPLLALLVACSHDAARQNPLDPDLTQPVSLSVATDDTAGTATLSWTRYDGQGAFAAYVVVRNIADRVAVDTLATVADAGTVTYEDSTLVPERTYSYRVLAANTSGHTVTSPAVNVALARPPSVQIEDLAFDSRTASAALSWSAYVGGGFHAYRVVREAAGQGIQVVTEIADVTTTSWVDAELHGSTDYTYRIDVVTGDGIVVEGTGIAGSFHSALQAWPLDLGEDETVRLYSEPDGIAALVASTSSVRLLLFDFDGTLREEQVVLQYPRTLVGTGTFLVNIAPASVAMALHPDGSRFLSLSTTHLGLPNRLTTWTMRVSRNGRARRALTSLFVDEVSAILQDGFVPVSGDIQCRAEGSSSYAIDEVRISSDGIPLMEDAFTSSVLVEGWVTDNYQGAEDSFGFLHQDAGWVVLNGNGEWGLFSRSDTSWQDISLDAEVMSAGNVVAVGGSLHLQIGREFPQSSAFTLMMDVPSQELRLEVFQPPRSRTEFSTPYAFVRGAVYGLSLGVENSTFSASIEDPVFWAGEEWQGSQVTSMALVEDFVALSVGEQPYNLASDAEAFAPSAFDVPVSETRSWQAAEEDLWLGVALPQAHEVRLRRLDSLSRGPGWPTSGTIVRLGSGLGHGDGEFAYPLSFDVGPDLRTFVLDAGNGRIQVFDPDNGFLTEWGEKGSDVGQFDFGSGSSPQDFAGSVAVDEEGFIYVADVGNRRIQKFAP